MTAGRQRFAKAGKLADTSTLALLAQIQGSLPGAAEVHKETIECAPEGKGAYLLLMRFDTPAVFSHKRTITTLPAGWYVYCGSAYGPGGIRARLRRHFRRDKTLHWHVDHLTVLAEPIQALAIAQGSECAVAAQLTRTRMFETALPGFGSSDCTTCPSHLLRWRS